MIRRLRKLSDLLAGEAIEHHDPAVERRADEDDIGATCHTCRDDRIRMGVFETHRMWADGDAKFFRGGPNRFGRLASVLRARRHRTGQGWNEGGRPEDAYRKHENLPCRQL